MSEADKKIKLKSPSLSKQFNQKPTEPKVKLLMAEPDQYSTEKGVYFKFSKDNTYAHIAKIDEIATVRGNETHSFVVLDDGRTSYFDCGVDVLQEALDENDGETTLDLTKNATFAKYMGQELAPKDIVTLCPLKRRDTEKAALQLQYTSYSDTYYEISEMTHHTVRDYKDASDKKVLYSFLSRSFYVPRSEMADILTAARLLGSVELDIKKRSKACAEYYKDKKKEAQPQKGVLEERLERPRPPRSRVMVI